MRLKFDITQDAPSAESVDSEIKRLKALKKIAILRLAILKPIDIISQFFIIILGVIIFFGLIVGGQDLIQAWSDQLEIQPEWLIVTCLVAISVMSFSELESEKPKIIDQEITSLSPISIEEDVSAFTRLLDVVRSRKELKAYFKTLKREPVWAEYTAAMEWDKEAIIKEERLNEVKAKEAFDQLVTLDKKSDKNL